jgi:protoporphyrinogen IX oxidase
MLLWLKAFHVISVVCWFAGLFYLPRLFVYHAMTKSEAVSDQLKVMEHRLYYYITWPAALCTAFFGFWMLFSNHAYYSHQLWLHIKLILVLTLAIYHLLCGYYLKKFRANQNTHTDKFYRIFNEYPTLILIIVVILSIVQPG